MKNKNLFLSIILILLIQFAINPVHASTNTSIYVGKDSYVDQALPNNNYGSLTSMYAYSYTSANKRSDIEFDISSLSGKTINSATLYVYIKYVPSPARTIRFSRLTATFTENTVTWNNQPATSETNYVTHATPEGQGWMTMTVTNQFKDAFNAGTTYGVRIRDNTEDSSTIASSTFATKEYSSGSLKAYVVVNWDEPAPPEERSYTFTETIKPSATLYQWQEHSHTLTETVTLSEILNQWQEQKHTFAETLISGAIAGQTQLFEYYNVGDDTYDNFFGANWRAQTFTVGATAHTVTSVKLLMLRSGSPGTVTVGIKATASGHPTGVDLTNGTINGNTFTTDFAGLWYQINFTEYPLSANTKYAIVIRALNGNSTNYVCTRNDVDPTYTDGDWEYSEDSGSTWIFYPNTEDLMFEIWEFTPGVVNIYYWQEQSYIYTESIIPSSILSHWIEEVHQFFEYSFTETLHPSTTMNFWQEQQYSFTETLIPILYRNLIQEVGRPFPIAIIAGAILILILAGVLVWKKR